MGHFWVLAANRREGTDWILRLPPEQRRNYSLQRIVTPGSVESFYGAASPTVVPVGRMRNLLDALRIAEVDLLTTPITEGDN